VKMRSALVGGFPQPRMVVCFRTTIGSHFQCQAVQEDYLTSDYLNLENLTDDWPETSATNYHFTPRKFPEALNSFQDYVETLKNWKGGDEEEDAGKDGEKK